MRYTCCNGTVEAGHEPTCLCAATSPAPATNPAKDDPRQPGPADPWKHRSAGMKCATCMWWVAKPLPTSLRGEVSPVLQQNGPLGRCRRHAPTMSGYPATYAADWCGDHKLDETKL